MKKVLGAISAASLIMMGAGAASAQTLVYAPGPGPGYISGDLLVRQTLPFDLPCDLVTVPVDVTSSTTAVTVVSSFPTPLCSSGLGAGVMMTSNWSMTVLDYDTVQIDGITANALGGTCGPGTVYAEVIDPGEPLQLYIPRQSIPGNPVDCWIEGYVTVHGVKLT